MTDANAITTLDDIPRLHARERGLKTALVFEGRKTTFAQFERHVASTAAALRGIGVQPGTRVAYLGKNSDHYLELLFACLRIGAIMTPINWRLATPEVAYIVSDARAPILFLGPEFCASAAPLTRDCTLLKHVIAMEFGGPTQWPTYAAWRNASSNVLAPMHTPKPSDIAVQLYTSGTTGRPKGAMLTHDNFVAMRRLSQQADVPWSRWTDDDIALQAMPVAHIGGTGFGIWALFYGVTTFIAREFDPLNVLDFIDHDRVSKLFLVPAAMQFIVRQPRARQIDYSRLGTVMYGASPIPPVLLAECIEVFKCGFVQMYGMTETTGTVVALAPEDHDLTRPELLRAAGRPLPGVELAILDANGRHLPTGAIGEIAIRSPATMAGYWNLPDATKAAIDGERWLRSGDAGYIDANGYLFVHDRIKDMIVSGAENVYPAEVENAIFGHPAVAEVAVIGVPSDKWGEEVKAIVVAKPDMAADAQSIIDWTRERVAGFKTPKSVDFVAALPRNAAGKILRRALREPYWRGRERRVN
jgi:acyl-CoA synthetase (AMP-forming)/AMP-acid ligase II